MDDLQRERDFYRQQCNDLGARLLRLQNEQTQTQRAVRRSRTTTRLVREIYQLANARISLNEIGQQFLQIILDTLSVDRVALLDYSPASGQFVAQHALGFSLSTPLSFSASTPPEAFYFVNAHSDKEHLPDYLSQAAGVPYWLWAFNVDARLALLVGNAVEDQHLHRPFEAGDREIIESALSVYIELTERKRAENLAAISQLAVKLAGASPDEDLRKILAEELKDITGAVITTVSAYDPKEEELIVKYIAGSGRLVSTINQLVENHPNWTRTPVSPEMRNRILADVVGNLPDLSEFTFGIIPKPVANSIEKALGIGEVRGLALRDGDKLLGTALVIMSKGRPPLPVDVLGIFSHVASVALQRKRAEEVVRTSLKEKEVLLKEIHHRVKNNLQVVSSLLNLQSRNIQDPQTREALKDSQNRVRSMALIHEKLYRSEDLAQIDFGDYIRELALFLIRSHSAQGRGISLDIQANDVLLKIDEAVPCGLILNELISNALKHAFPDNQPGEIRVVLEQASNNQIQLTVGDNGVGFPTDLDFRNTASLGMQLVSTLTDQLDGTVELDSTHGTEFKIAFTPAL